MVTLTSFGLSLLQNLDAWKDVDAMESTVNPQLQQVQLCKVQQVLQGINGWFRIIEVYLAPCTTYTWSLLSTLLNMQVKPVVCHYFHVSCLSEFQQQ